MRMSDVEKAYFGLFNMRALNTKMDNGEIDEIVEEAYTPRMEFEIRTFKSGSLVDSWVFNVGELRWEKK